MKKVKLVIVGAGCRGTGYAEFAIEHPEKTKIVGTAEPRRFFREELAKKHNIDGDKVFAGWEQLAAQPKFADAALICTQDRLHMEPMLALAKKGYDILLEKPMAPTEAECAKITSAAIKNKIIFGVCHVMRYTPYTQKLKTLVDSGAIGDLVSMQHLEPVGYWHMAHSFVRGNWRNEKQSSFMLLAKSCHDLDWIRYFMGEECVSVQSFGGLRHFTKKNQPKNAANRCLDCGYEPKCPYSAKRIYLQRLNDDKHGWPVNVITNDHTRKGVLEALRKGPYGRCVYTCDNDVVDHQTVNMLFKSGRTASFNMEAFNAGGHRRTRLFGTHGFIEGDGNMIHHFDFLTERWKAIETTSLQGSILGGHGGGDYGIMKAFVSAGCKKGPINDSIQPC